MLDVACCGDKSKTLSHQCPQQHFAVRKNDQLPKTHVKVCTSSKIIVSNTTTGLDLNRLHHTISVCTPPRILIRDRKNKNLWKQHFVWCPKFSEPFKHFSTFMDEAENEIKQKKNAFFSIKLSNLLVGFKKLLLFFFGSCCAFFCCINESKNKGKQKSYSLVVEQMEILK